MKNQWKYCFYFFRIYTKITHRDLLFNGQQIFNKKKISSDFNDFLICCQHYRISNIEIL